MHKQKQHFNWETHQNIMGDILNFLEENELRPSKLNISGEGWAEIYFLDRNAGKNSRKWWTKMKKRGLIELKQPLLEMQIAGGTALRVEFRLIEAEERGSRIGRLLTFVS